LVPFDRLSQKDDQEQQNFINKSLRAFSEIGYAFMIGNSERDGENIPVLSHDSFQGITKAAYNRIDISKAFDPSEEHTTSVEPKTVTICEVLECNEKAEITCCESNFCIDIQVDCNLVASVCNRSVCIRYHKNHEAHQLFKPQQMINKARLKNKNLIVNCTSRNKTSESNTLSKQRYTSTGSSTSTSKKRKKQIYLCITLYVDDLINRQSPITIQLS
jgi:hypothetical protein